MKKIFKKKNPIKAKKQKLIEKINQCKSLKELKQLERTFSYYDVLKNDQDWDYDFFLDLIEFKLRRMREYFWSHNIVKNEKQYGDICDKLINILHAGYKSDIVANSDLEGIYVNTKNAKRFLKKYYYDIYILNSNRTDYWDKYGLAMIREEKAKALFWKYLHHHIEKLWD